MTAIRDTGGTGSLKTIRPAAQGTRPLDPAAVETSKLVKNAGDAAPGFLNKVYDGFRSIDRNDLKLVGTVALSAAAAATVADKLHQMHDSGRTMSGGQRAQGLASVALPLAQAFAKATGHGDLASGFGTANDANTAAKKSQDMAKNAELLKLAGKNKTAFRAEVSKMTQGRELTTLGKVAAGANVARGVISAAQLGGQIMDAVHDPSKLKDPKFAVDLAYNTLGTASGAVAVAQLAGKTGLAAKVNPILGIGFSAAGVASAAIDIHKNGLNWDNGLQLAGNTLDLAGNALILSGVGAPIGVALKVAGLGLQVGQLAVKNWPAIKKFGGDVAKAAVNGAKALAGAVSDAGKTIGNAASSVANAIGGGLKKVFSGW